MTRLRLRPRHSLVCRQAVELVTDYLEGALSQTQRRRFEVHLTRCPDCPEYLAQMRAVITLTGIITLDDMTPRMRGEFIELYRRWRADEAPDSL
jgi:anti-sigma factor RsiW